jgi:pimeloyl-ACP methyl ester carboxylesterase
MRILTRRQMGLGLGLGLGFASMTSRASPLASPGQHTTTQNTTITDPSDGRTITIKLFAATARARRKSGFIVFSHGANSSGALYDAMLAPLAAAGFVVAAPTHVDSEANPNRARYSQADIFATRLRDLNLITEARVALATQMGAGGSKFEAQNTVIAGHSYGALMALYLVGARQTLMGGASGALPPSIANPLFRAAIAVSPPGPIPGFLTPEQFGTINRPILVTTGQKDILPGFVDDWRSRLIAFETSPRDPAYCAILPDVDHYFGGAIGRLTQPGPPQRISLEATNHVAGLFARGFGAGDRASVRALNALAARPVGQQPYPELELRRRH